MIKSKILKWILAILVSIVFVFLFCELLRRKVGSFAGSYPFAETWVIHKNIHDIESNIKEMQGEDPSLFMDSNSVVISPDYTGYYKRVDFFYPERQEVLNVLIRANGEETTIALISFINKETGEVRMMNKDFNFFENREEKIMFKNRILKYL